MIAKLYCFIATAILLVPACALAQDPDWGQTSSSAENKTPQGWTTELSLGLDFVSTLALNPTVGGGRSQLGATGSLELKMDFRETRFEWTNLLNLNYGIQKSGNGLIPIDNQPGLYVRMPFQKNIDNIWFNSRASMRTSYFSHFYYAGDLFFNSQLTPTYNGNFLSDVNQVGYPISQFLAPGTLQLSAGMNYKPNNFLSFFFTPASLKLVMVLDENIADDVVTDNNGNIRGTVHGNPFTENPGGTVTFEKTDLQVGATFRVTYENEVTEKLSLNGNLLLFSDYLDNPDHIDVNFRGEINFALLKGLKLSLLSFLTYDHDIFVQKTDNNMPGGVDGFTRSISYTQQVLLKYSYVF